MADKHGEHHDYTNIYYMIGGALGIVLGVVLGGLLVARVDFIDFTLPVVQLIVFAIAAVFVGIVAAIFPARRASTSSRRCSTSRAPRRPM